MNQILQIVYVYSTARPLLQWLLSAVFTKQDAFTARVHRSDERAELFEEIRRMTSILELERRDLWRR